MQRFNLTGMVMIAMALSTLAADSPAVSATFGEEVAFLKKHTDVLVLQDPDSQARVAVIPGMQGRVMTSSAEGEAGASYGWINHELIALGERQPHFNAFGGEERFWLGPEGGQFSLFFKPGDAFDLEHWQTPEPIDWGPWEVVRKAVNSAQLRKAFSLTNYSGTQLDLVVNRTVTVYSRTEIEKTFGLKLPDSVKAVGYQTDNRVTNAGKKPWVAKSGMVSIWILCMFNPSPQTTIVIPFKPGPEDELGPIVNDTYFGKVPAERLRVDKKSGVLFFSGDGRYRSKIGIPPKRAKDTLGSWAADTGTLTLAKYTLPKGALDYVNSMWEIQERPYRGDVANSYNDGPPAPGKKPLGPFYELESSSPALALLPGMTGQHIHRTLHLQGPRTALDAVAKSALGVGLAEIEK